MYCACVHAENNITRLTKPFFSSDRRAHTRHAHTHTHSTTRVDMCFAQPVIIEALMWSLGGTEASYYCRFMTTFTLLLYNTPFLPPSFSFSLPHVYPDPASFFPLYPSSLRLPPHPNPHPFLLLLQWDACLFLVCKPSWHTSPGQRADIGVFFGRGKGGADSLVSICRGTNWEMEPVQALFPALSIVADSYCFWFFE